MQPLRLFARISFAHIRVNADGASMHHQSLNSTRKDKAV